MADISNPKVDSKVQPKNPKKKTKANPLVVTLLVFIILLLGTLVYLFFTDKVMVVGLENPFVGDGQDQEEVAMDGDEDITVEESEDELDNVVSRDGVIEDSEEVIDGKVYANSTIGISLVYPEGWEIGEESLNYIKNINNGEVKDLSLELSIVSEEGDTTFNYEVPFGHGHEYCVFEDSLDLVEGTLQNEYEGYMEYEGEEYVYRVAYVEAYERPVCKCKRIEDGVGCNNWMNPGYVTFGLEDGVGDGNLRELFDILESIEYTGELYKAANEASSLM